MADLIRQGGDNFVGLSLDYSISSPKWGLVLGTAIYEPGWDLGVSKGLISYMFKGIKYHVQGLNTVMR